MADIWCKGLRAGGDPNATPTSARLRPPSSATKTGSSTAPGSDLKPRLPPGGGRLGAGSTAVGLPGHHIGTMSMCSLVNTTSLLALLRRPAIRPRTPASFTVGGPSRPPGQPARATHTMALLSTPAATWTTIAPCSTRPSAWRGRRLRGRACRCGPCSMNLGQGPPDCRAHPTCAPHAGVCAGAATQRRGVEAG